jgi:hypothetical protein
LYGEDIWAPEARNLVLSYRGPRETTKAP